MTGTKIFTDMILLTTVHPISNTTALLIPGCSHNEKVRILSSLAKPLQCLLAVLVIPPKVPSVKSNIKEKQITVEC
jgi:hypothetical protein